MLLLFTICAFAQDFHSWVGEQKAAPEQHIAISEGYSFAVEHYQALDALIEQNPEVVEVRSIGTTVQGEPIWAFSVRQPVGTPARKVLLFSGIHAMEWISTEVSVATLKELITHPPRSIQVTVIPLLNPDGRKKVELDLIAGQTRKYRRGNANNTDLNRDFSVNTKPRAIWRKFIAPYYHHSPKPLSQPESVALDELANKERFDRAASLHAFGGFFYYPWSGRWKKPADLGDLIALGRDMEQAQGAHAYRTRQLSRWGFFFRAQGTELDHLYGKYGTYTFLVELTRSGVDPSHPFRSWKTPFRWYNPIRPNKHIERGVAAMRSLIYSRARDPLPRLEEIQ